MKLNWNVQSDRVSSLPSELYGQMYNLNHGILGRMRRIFAELRTQQCSDTRVFYVTMENVLMGWAMVFPVQREPMSYQPSKYEIHFYVDASHRHKGIGSTIAKVIRESYNGIAIGGHTEYSSIMSRHGIPNIYAI